MSACPACRAALPEGARFCPACGTRLDASCTGSTERKVVSTLFADLVGFTALGERHDPEDIDAALRGFYALARKIIERFGGTVEKYIGDAVVGLFGVPLAHEDDAERAVRAALEIVAGIRELPPVGDERLQVRCAVNTGPALVRLDARVEAGEGVLVGDAVNTAARLLSDAPAMGVVVGELTQRLSAREIAYETMAARAAKGKEKPVERWLARGRVARYGLDPRPRVAAPMVGREVELATLDALLAKAVASSTPQFVLVSGEAGIGKSRLVGEFFRLVDERPDFFVHWRQGRCPPYGDGLAFWAVGEIVSAHAGILRTDDPATVEQKLTVALPDPDDEWLRQRLRPLVGLPAAQAGRQQNFAAWLTLLQKMAGKLPAVIVVEDLHWASAPTLEFLDHVVRNASGVPLLLIGTARPEFLDADERSGAYRDGVTHLHLRALSRTDSRRLACALAPIANRDELSASVANACGGNPLFAEELAWLLSEQGLPAGEPDFRGSSRPHVIAALMAARLDTLPREQRAVLADASVIGDAFWPGAVAALGATDPRAVATTLDRLETREFVRRQAESTHPDEVQYTFWHALTRDVVYGQLTRDVRAEKHERAAHWIEGHASKPARDLADVLAHHYLTALQLRRDLKDDGAVSRLAESAATHLYDAGAQAMSLDLASATRSLRQARDLLPQDHPLRPRIDLLLGKTLAQRGESDEAHQVLQEAIDGYMRLGAPRDAAVALSELSMVTWYVDGDRRSEDISAEALRLLPDDEPCPELVLVLETCAAVNARHFDSLAVITLADRAIDLAATLGLDPPVRALHYRALARCDLGDATGLTDFRQALEIAKQLATSDVGIMSWNLVQDILVYEGPRSAIRAVEEWCAFAERRGDAYSALGHRSRLAWCLFRAGEWQAADALASELDGELERRGMWLDLEDHRSLWSQILDLKGETEQAAPLAEWAERRGREGSGNRIDCLVALAGVRLSQGDVPAARGLLEELVETTPHPKPVPFALVTPAAVRIAASCDDRPLMEALLDGLVPQRAFDRCVIRAGGGFLTELAGNTAWAERAFAEASEAWEHLDEPYESAHCLLGQGRCLLGLGRPGQAETALRRAADVFSRLGAMPALDLTTALLSRTP